MISSAAPKNFTDTAALKQRFQQAAAQSKEKQEVVDKLQRMADGFLSLDGTKFDQDKEDGSVALGDDKGLIAFVQAHPFGGALSMEVLDERGGDTKEYKIDTDLGGVSYSMNVAGVEHSVYESGNGLLALMSQIQELMPPDKGESPDESDAPKEKAPEGF